MDFAQKLIFVRSKKGWNQTEAGKALGITQTSVSAIEKGTRNPSKKIAVIINELLEEVCKDDEFVFPGDLEMAAKIAKLEGRIVELKKKVRDYKKQNQELLAKLAPVSVVDNRQNKNRQ